LRPPPPPRFPAGDPGAAADAADDNDGDIDDKAKTDPKDEDFDKINGCAPESSSKSRSNRSQVPASMRRPLSLNAFGK
jgi:hypothetical protein